VAADESIEGDSPRDDFHFLYAPPMSISGYAKAAKRISFSRMARALTAVKASDAFFKKIKASQ
jgi:hypothetical protein